MTKKPNNETFKRWIDFWNKRGSLFIQNAKTSISGEKLLRSTKLTDKDRLNLFFSINGYKTESKSRKTKDITRLNAFFFDIDLKGAKNEGVGKREALELIEAFAEQFDFIVETNNGFHLYILLHENRYSIEDMDEYLKDWKEKGEELQSAIGLEFDPACFLPTQISRVAGSLHQKTQITPTTIKLIKGEEILFPTYQVQKKIDNIKITDVLEALHIEYRDDTIIENGRETNGRKINIADNYINDFSNKGRPAGGPFSFVKYRFIKYGNLHSNKQESIAQSKTYHFFSEHFGIVQALKNSRTIAIPQILEKILIEGGLTGMDIQTILVLISYSRKYYQDQLPYGNRVIAPITDILKTVGISENSTNFNMKLKEIIRKLDLVSIKANGLFEPFIALSIKKTENDRMIDYTISPTWRTSKKLRNSFYDTHYINAKIFEISSNGKLIQFYLKIASEMLFSKTADSYEAKKSDICKFFGDENFPRIRSKLVKMSGITKDFTIELSGSFVKFLKV